MIREARTDADLAAYARVWREISPRDAVSVEFVKDRLAREPERLYVLAEEERRAVGCGLVAGSNFPGRRFVIVGVVTEARRRGLGSALLDRCLAHARSLGAETAESYVWEDCAPGLAFARHHGFTEFERGVEFALDLGEDEPPPPPPGIEIREIAPEHYPGAYEIWIEGVADIPTSEPADMMPYDKWLKDGLEKELVLVALDGDTVVGFAALENRDREAGLASNDLTTVRRSHRRRGIAEALKRTQLARARELGYRTVVTGQDEGNLGMRRLNEKLGYRSLPATIMIRRSLAR
jgi:L-amino acid N-acyltransferase YncA